MNINVSDCNNQMLKLLQAETKLEYVTERKGSVTKVESTYTNGYTTTSYLCNGVETLTMYKNGHSVLCNVYNYEDTIH